EASATTPPVASVESIPPGPITLIMLGDSLTQGDGDESGRGYPGRLLDIVNAIRPGSTVVNLGQSGWNSEALINGDQGLPGQLDRAVEQAASASRPVAAFVWIGSNDMWYLYEYGEGSDDADAQDVAHFANNIETIVSRLRDAGATVFIALLDDQSKRPVAIKGEAFPGTTPDELARMSRIVVRYNEAIVAKAAQYGAITADFYNTTIFTDPATLYDDGNHPNPSGYDQIAQLWFASMEPLLK
ncbi:MAG: SGNH/GDSL hydrolase family protein, partial [Chloroflexota bacterium]